MFSATIFCLLSSGSLFAAAFFQKRFEEILPITCMSISAILFIFGMLGIMKSGFFFILITILVLTAAAVLHICIHKKFTDFIKRFFTPAFLFFAFLFLIICVCNKGKLAVHTDDFSHWVDSVKSMFFIDDFVTNENSYSLFKSYPPAMALFQYFFEKLNGTFFSGNVFVEEKVYVAYQVFCVSLVLPFFKRLNAKRIFKFLISGLVIICAPCLFYPDILSVVLIDPFLSILTACAFANLLLDGKPETINHIYISLICFTLVLAKDAGLYFACFICICHIIKSVCGFSFKGLTKYQHIKNAVVCFLPVFATAISRVLWKIEIKTSGVSISGGKTELITYSKMFFFKGDQTYRQDVVEKFKKAFFENRISLGDLDFTVSYFMLTVLACLTLFLFVFLYSKSIEGKKNRFAFKFTSVIMILQLAFYVYALGAIYIANFSEYEAQNLASYQRYMDIPFRAVYITAVICLTCYFNSVNTRDITFAFLVATVLILTPFTNIYKFATREGVRESVSVRNKYIEIINDINVNCEENSKIYFISQEDKGYDYQLIRFSSRPRVIDNYFAWSISENGPLFEGDIWTKTMSVAEFKDVLFNEGYDYVVIYKTNDYFADTYAPLFETPDDIKNNSVFRFDKENQVLKRVNGLK